MIQSRVSGGLGTNFYFIAVVNFYLGHVESRHVYDKSLVVKILLFYDVNFFEEA